MSKFDLDHPPAASTTRSSAGEDYEMAQRLRQLPPYARSLLRIQVPVVVTLAQTRQPVSRVLDLAPGTILHFNKACDDPLTVSIGRCDVAVGETVKVGDKFVLEGPFWPYNIELELAGIYDGTIENRNMFFHH